jgi:hypothetical protein
MKKILCFLFIIFLSVYSCLYAQTDSLKINKKAAPSFVDDKDAKNEMGFDMSYFLSLFKSLQTAEPSNIFSVQYNRDLSEKITLRTTLGLGYQNLNNKQDTLPSLNSKDFQCFIRVGLAWEKKIYGRWQIYYGADIEYQLGNSSEQQLTQYANDINIYTDKYYEIGAGPFLGLTLFLNSKVSLNIETNLHFFYSDSREDNVNLERPALTNHTDIKGMTTSFYVPQDIFLNMKF